MRLVQSLRPRVAIVVAGLLHLGGGVLSAAPLAAQGDTAVTEETIRLWMDELSNRGRWGADDERGTLNLITPEHRIRAAGLVREGITVSLSHDYIKEEAADATSPWGHELLGSGTGAFLSDRYTIAYHGFAHSHMDALCHNSFEGVMYNGISRDTVNPEEGVRLSGLRPPNRASSPAEFS